jgi:hypothetical protein
VVYEIGEPWWNDIDRGNQRTRRKTRPSATLSATNPTWTDPDLHGQRPVTNHLSHGTALMDKSNIQAGSVSEVKL